MARHAHKVVTIAQWALAVCACCWIGWCTSVGPIYRANGSITQYSWQNACIFIVITGLTLAIVALLARRAEVTPITQPDLPMPDDAPDTDTSELAPAHASYALAHKAHATRNAHTAHTAHTANRTDCNIDRTTSHSASAYTASTYTASTRTTCMQRCSIILTAIGERAVWLTANRHRIYFTLLIGWSWAWVCFLVAFGADIFSQFSEFRSLYLSIMGNPVPYIKDGLSVLPNNDGTSSFTNVLDIYPTAHYLWPDHPTFLTNQHNVVLTVIYGAVGLLSYQLTWSYAPALIVLAGAQYILFAIILARTAFRCLHFGIDSRLTLAIPSRTKMIASSLTLLVLLNPAIAVASLSLTKSPLFAIALVWWFGCCYQIHRTIKIVLRKQHAHLVTLRNSDTKQPLPRLRRRTYVELALASTLMLISAKYAVMLLVLAIVTTALAWTKHRRVVVISMLLPVVAFQLMLFGLIHAGIIIDGDPIEGKSLQLQQISRVAQRNPSAITPQLHKELDPIINLNNAAKAYFPQDADRVKSSGSNTDKLTVYKWTSVTRADMAKFNHAWLELAKRAPVEYVDAFMASAYGYFDVADPPYVSVFYYANNATFRHEPMLERWMFGIRQPVTQFLQSWDYMPVVGWVLHGNFWTVACLLVGATEIVLGRWRVVAWHLPIALLMGVMILAPANNFDRHMLPMYMLAAFMMLQLTAKRRAKNETQTLLQVETQGKSQVASQGKSQVETQVATSHNRTLRRYLHQKK